MELVKRWINEYQNINKQFHIKEWSPENMKSPKEFFEQLALMHIPDMIDRNFRN